MIIAFLYSFFSYTIYPIFVGYNYIKASFYNITYKSPFYLYKKHHNELYEYYIINKDTNSIYYYMLKYNDHTEGDHHHILNNITRYDNHFLNASLFVNEFVDEQNVIDITNEFKKFAYYHIKHETCDDILRYIKNLHKLTQPFSIEIMYNDDDFSTLKLTYTE
jgi:hypothetical protein